MFEGPVGPADHQWRQPWSVGWPSISSYSRMRDLRSMPRASEAAEAMVSAGSHEVALERFSVPPERDGTCPDAEGFVDVVREGNGVRSIRHVAVATDARLLPALGCGSCRMFWSMDPVALWLWPVPCDESGDRLREWNEQPPVCGHRRAASEAEPVTLSVVLYTVRAFPSPSGLVALVGFAPDC